MIEIKEFCLLVLGDSDGVKEELTNISEDTVRCLNAGGLQILTFETNFNISELRTLFQDMGKNFLIFELDEKTSAYNLNDKNFQKILFEGGTDNNIFENEEDDVKLSVTKTTDDKFNDLLKTIRGIGLNETNEKETSIKRQDRLRKSHNKSNGFSTIRKINIDNMEESELHQLMDSLLDKPSEMLSNEDRELLEKITNKLRKS